MYSPAHILDDNVDAFLHTRESRRHLPYDVDGFRLKNGLSSALLGAVAYSVISAVFIRVLGLGDVGLLRAAGA